jgi:1-acyl-sn-glycerol-3-phosphate acyltransferase
VAAIFPEGELWKKENPPVGDFAPGVVYLHRKSAAPILPIGVCISERRWPRRNYVAELGLPIVLPEDRDQEEAAAWLREVVLKLHDQAKEHGINEQTP